MVFTPDTHTAVLLPLKDLRHILTHAKFDKSKKTVIYIHGWLESGAMDLSVLAIRHAYLDRGDHNVISCDWSYYARNVNYKNRVIPQLKIIAEVFAEQLRDFFEGGDYPITNVHLVGHSLGGQMTGKIGRQLKKITSGKLIFPRIIALDPAGPGFEDSSLDGFEPITQTDAQYVQVIHTCGGFLGMQRRVGTVDFYPNGGSNQVGCDVDVTSTLLVSYQHICAHARSWAFYQETVRDPQRFPAVRCSSWDDFVQNKNCYRDDVAFMGFGADPNQSGKYYLQTNGNMFNLSRHMEGVAFQKVNVTRLVVPGEDVDATDLLNLEDQCMF